MLTSWDVNGILLLLVISTCHVVLFVVKTINCDAHFMTSGAPFVTDSIPQLRLDPQKPDPQISLAAWPLLLGRITPFPLKTSTCK